MGKKLTVEDGKNALEEHITTKAFEILEKYNNITSMSQLFVLLQDRDYVRFPTTIEYSDEIDSETFGYAEKKSEDCQDGYKILIKKEFENNPSLVVPMVIYLLVTVNYGEFATFKEAEIFGSILCGIDQEDYYNLLCNAVDQLKSS